MGVFDQEWNRVVQKIVDQGHHQPLESVTSKYKDGTPSPTIFLPMQHMYFPDLNKLPITQHKFINLLKPLVEKDLFWKLKSNVVEDLRKLGTGIWDDWEITEGKWQGTIGPSYGFVLGRPVHPFKANLIQKHLLDPSKEEMYAQRTDTASGIIMLDTVDYLMQAIKQNSMSRYLISSLWDTQYLYEMSLKPCVWNTNTCITPDGDSDLINMSLGIRSNDMALGNPYNIYQYAVLVHELAHVLDLGVGSLEANITNAHIYDRHEDNVRKLLQETTDLPEATITINPRKKNFYEIDSATDITINHVNPEAPVYKFPLSIS